MRQVEERFWSKVDKSGKCWIWTASKNVDGYGKFGVGSTTVRAHRKAFELTVGPIPAGASVSQTCRNHACVRPDHLRLGEHADATAASSSGHRGVSWNAVHKKWQGRVRKDGVTHSAGYFADAEDAVYAVRELRASLLKNIRTTIKEN